MKKPDTNSKVTEILIPWRKDLICNQNGTPKPILANAITALRGAPEWRGVLGFNEFSVGVATLKPAPWVGAATGAEWTDHEDRLTCDWLQHNSVVVPLEIAGQAVQTVAKDRCFHPVKNYLDGLKWDGKERIGNWLSVYLGAQACEYATAVGSRWLISAVARIYQPGAKSDCCLILEGKQGSGKSTALKTLAGPWFTDEIADLGSKDASLQTRGVWIIEIAELDSMSRGEVGRIKAFMSRSMDRFRPPYSARLIESPRQCSFAGSVNHSEYLRDETGGRRFWPVACGKILIDELKRDRDQLWAEAVVRFRAGSAWWLDSKELNEVAELEQSDRYDGDVWEGLIAAWVEQPTQRYESGGNPVTPFTSDDGSVTVEDILTHAIDKPKGQWSQGEKNRVARCLKAMGWERYNHRNGIVRSWRYRRDKS